jgi:putative molybdopterin biosynthesis protein
VGILAAARALGLDFVPLAVERYELAAPRAQLRDERIQRLLEVLASAAFKKALEGLGGYDTSETAAQREA